MINVKDKLGNSVFLNIFKVATVTLVIKTFGFIKEMQVGKVYGLSESIDSFLIAFMLPGFFNSVFMVSFQNLFVPNYVAQIRNSSDIRGFQTAAFLIVISLASTLMLFSYLFTDVFLESFFQGHSKLFYILVREQSFLILPCLFFWSLTSFLAGLLEINGKFVKASVYGVFTPIITLILLLYFDTSFNKTLLSIGLLFGSITEFVFVIIVALNSTLICLGKPNFRDAGIINLYRQFPLKVISGILSGSTGFINQFFAAQLVVGSLASLNFALKVPAFIVSIFSIAIGNVTLPLFSRLAIENTLELFKALNRVIYSVFFFSSFLIIGLVYFSNDIIEILFQGGKFNLDSTIVVSNLMKIFLIFIPFYINGIVLNKVFTSLNKNRFLLISSTINLFICFILNFLLGNYFGIYGVAIATTCTSVFNYFVLIVLVRHVKFHLEP